MNSAAFHIWDFDINRHDGVMHLHESIHGFDQVLFVLGVKVGRFSYCIVNSLAFDSRM